MKIAVTGTHRVGKSSLAEKLKEVLPGFESRAEAYEELMEAGHEFPEIPSPDDYLLLLNHSIKQFDTSQANIIYDRCPLDYLAYILATADFANFDIRSWYQRVKDIMKQIDLLVFVPIEYPDLIYCPESGLPGLRLKVNDILIDWLGEYNQDYIEVSGSVQSRATRVIDHLSIKNL